MLQRLFSVIAFLAAWYPCVWWTQARGSEIIAESDAARHGLTRPWWTQVEMDSGHSRLKHLLLYEGILYAQTDRAMVHALDAETGATLWAKQIGRPEHPSMTPGLGRNLLAIVNGSRLYVANRLTGEMLFETDIDGAPGAGPAVGNARIYVPTLTGMLLGYKMEQLGSLQKKSDKKDLLAEESAAEKSAAEKSSAKQQQVRVNQKKPPPLSCQSKGMALVQPLITRQNAFEEYFVWATDQNYMYIGRIVYRADSHIEIKYRLQTAAPMITQPVYLPSDPKITGDSGVIFAAFADGYISAVSDKNGEIFWRFSTGESLTQPAVLIDERLYAATSLGGLHCINAKTGTKIWYAPGVVQFVSASKSRVYGADKPGQILALDAATGAKLDLLPAASLPVKLINSDTDRIYLATPTGLIQCLREIDLTKPIIHGEERKKAAEEATKASPEQKSDQETVPEKPAADTEPAEKEPEEESL